MLFLLHYLRIYENRIIPCRIRTLINVTVALLFPSLLPRFLVNTIPAPPSPQSSSDPFFSFAFIVGHQMLHLLLLLGGNNK